MAPLVLQLETHIEIRGITVILLKRHCAVSQGSSSLLKRKHKIDLVHCLEYFCDMVLYLVYENCHFETILKNCGEPPPFPKVKLIRNYRGYNLACCKDLHWVIR